MPLLPSLWITLGSAVARAQGGPEVHAESLGGLSVEAVNGRSTASVDTRLAVHAVGFSTPMPPLRVFDGRWAVVPLIDFEYTRLRLEGAELPSSADHDLFRARVGVLNIVELTEAVDLAALVQPGLYSDFGGPLSAEDVGWTALALGSWAVSGSLSVGAGAGYVQFFGRPRWTPFGQLQLDRDRLQIDALLPRTAEIWWRAAGAGWLGAVAAIDGGFYRIHPSSTEAVQAVFQEYSRSRAGLGARLVVRERLLVELTGAVIPKTRATVYLDADTSLFAYELSPG
jgi:hypothetical protein